MSSVGNVIAQVVKKSLVFRLDRNKESLTKVGNSLYRAADEAGMKDFEGEFLQGYLETSNVNTIREMVDMINISKNYETNQKILQIHDQLLQRSVNDIGKL